MGISVLSAYRGGCNFEAVGLSRSVITKYFPGMISRISGIGIAGIEKKIPLYLIKFKQLLKYLSTHLTTAGSKKILNVMLISCHAALLY